MMCVCVCGGGGGGGGCRPTTDNIVRSKTLYISLGLSLHTVQWYMQSVPVCVCVCVCVGVQ